MELIEVEYKKIKLGDLKEIYNSYQDGNEINYIIQLDNCNDISISLLDELERMPFNLKFSIEGDCFCNNGKNAFGRYNYDIDQLKEIINKMDFIKKSIPDGLSEIERFMFIYRIICDNVRYTHMFDLDSYDQAEGLTRSLYGFFINGEAVCRGFSLVLSNMLEYVGINCIIVSGVGYTSVASDLHAWNVVKINNQWYMADPTWDSSSPELLENCLKMDDKFFKEHQLHDYVIERIKDLKFASKNYDEEELKRVMDKIYKDTPVNEVVGKLKQEKVESGFMTAEKFVESLYEMSPADLIKEMMSFINEDGDSLSSSDKDKKV